MIVSSHQPNILDKIWLMDGNTNIWALAVCHSIHHTTLLFEVPDTDGCVLSQASPLV